MEKTHDYRRNSIDRIPLNRLLKVIIKPHTKRQKKRGKNIEETSGCVRQERVIRWPKSMLVG
jgi:hypothetical protein